MIKLDPKHNIGMTHTTLGIHKFKEFITQQLIQTPCPCCFDTHIILDDDDISLQPLDPIDPDDQEQPPPFLLQQQQEQPLAPKELGLMTLPPKMQIEFSPLQQIKPNLIEGKEDPSTLTQSDELLCWHYKLGHAPFKTLQRMATQGELPRKLAMVIPVQ